MGSVCVCVSETCAFVCEMLLFVEALGVFVLYVCVLSWGSLFATCSSHEKQKAPQLNA